MLDRSNDTLDRVIGLVHPIVANLIQCTKSNWQQCEPVEHLTDSTKPYQNHRQHCIPYHEYVDIVNISHQITSEQDNANPHRKD